MQKVLILILFSVLSLNGKTIIVNTSKELMEALNSVTAGQTIRLSDGHYNHEIGFTASTDGTKETPITLIGSNLSIISSSSYGFSLKASHWILKGFTVSHSKKGIVLDRAKYNILEYLTVHHIKEEGIHFRNDSTDNILRNSHIYDTGRRRPGFGEGVYIGSSVSNILINPLIFLVNYFYAKYISINKLIVF